MRSLAVAHAVLALAFSGSITAGCRHEPPGAGFVSGSCPEQRRSWTRGELTEIAVAKVETDHEQIDRVETWQLHCRILVTVHWTPRAAREPSTVVVSAIDGSVLELIGGP